MDAVEFIEKRNRMCKSCGSCFTCPAHIEDNSCKFHVIRGGGATEQIKLVEKWSAAHPIKTRQSVFLEQYPNATKDEDGVLLICPKYLTVGVSCVDKSGFKDCKDCRREFWMQEVE